MKMKHTIQHVTTAAKERLARLPYRTGIIITLLCIPCYIISFAQMLLPISAAMKGVLWFVFFGLAKSFQYGGLAVLGAKGLGDIFKRNKKKAD